MTTLDSILNTKSEFGGFIPYDYADPSAVSLPYDTVLEEVELFFLPNSELDCLQPVNYKACFFGTSHSNAFVSTRLIIADRLAQLEFWSSSSRLGTFEIGQDIIPNNERETKSGHCRFIMSLSLHSQPIYRPTAAGNNPVNNTMISLIRYIRFYLRSESDLRDAFCAAKRLAIRSNDDFTIAVIQGGPVLSYLSCLSEDAMSHTFHFEQSFLAQSGNNNNNTTTTNNTAIINNNNNNNNGKSIDRPQKSPSTTTATTPRSPSNAPVVSPTTSDNHHHHYHHHHHKKQLSSTSDALIIDFLAKQLDHSMSLAADGVDDNNSDSSDCNSSVSPTEPKSPSGFTLPSADPTTSPPPPRHLQLSPSSSPSPPPLQQLQQPQPQQRYQLPQLDLSKARKLLPPTFSFAHMDLQMYIVSKLNKGQVRVHQLTFELCRALSYAKSVQGFRAAQAVVDLLSHDPRVQFTNIDAVTIFILQNEIVGWGRLRNPENQQQDFSSFGLYSLCQVAELRDCGVRMSWVSLATLNDRECEKLQLILKQTLNRPISPTFTLSLRKAARFVVRDIVVALLHKRDSDPQ